MSIKMDLPLTNNKLFEGIDSTRLFSMGNECTIEQGDYIIKEGEEPDEFYIIKDGTVEVTKTNPDNPDLNYFIQKLKRGDIFGEIGLIGNMHRTASVRALTPVILVKFSIKKLSIENAEILQKLKTNLIELIANRIDDLHQQVDKTMRLEIKKSRQLRFYQSIAILVLVCCTIELGFILYSVYNKAGFCEDINKAKDVPTDVPHMGL